MAELTPKERILRDLAAVLGSAYWQLGLGFMGWQTVAPAIRKGILEPLNRYYQATYRFGDATAHQILTLWQAGIVGTGEAIVYLQNLGYDDTAIAILMHYYAIRIYDDIAEQTIAKLKEELNMYEEAIAIHLKASKRPEKSMLYKYDEIMELSKRSLKYLVDKYLDVKARIEELKYRRNADLWRKILAGVPEIKIKSYTLPEKVKKKLAVIPEVARIPAPPPAAPPPAKPPKKVERWRKITSYKVPFKYEEIKKWLAKAMSKGWVSYKMAGPLFSVLRVKKKRCYRASLKGEEFKLEFHFDGENWEIDVYKKE